jgi:hypothetical protein
MKKGSFIILVIAVAVVAAWELWLFPTWTIRYRLTLDVAVGDEIKTGSGVIETVWHDQWIPFPLAPIGRPWGVDVRGEAVVVDLGSRGVLFALLAADETRLPSRSDLKGSASPPSFLLDAFYGPTGQGNATRQMLSELKSRRDIVEVPPGLLPLLVRFSDISDPTSIERVNPGDLAKSFGPNVKLVRATAQIVRAGIWPFNQSGRRTPQWLFGEPVTAGVDQRRPWFRKQAGHLSGQLIEDHVRPERNVTLGAFVQGMKP